MMQFITNLLSVLSVRDFALQCLAKAMAKMQAVISALLLVAGSLKSVTSSALTFLETTDRFRVARHSLIRPNLLICSSKSTHKLWPTPQKTPTPPRPVFFPFPEQAPSVYTETGLYSKSKTLPSKLYRDKYFNVVFIFILKTQTIEKIETNKRLNILFKKQYN